MRNPYPKFVWFFGIVEDTSSDPLRLGRVRVRAVGFHPSSANTTDLPYAPVLNGGAARISNGQMVLGFFMDGEEAQQPCVLGTITGAVTGSNFVDNLKRAGITLRGIVEDIVENIGEAIEEIFPESTSSESREFWTLVAICAAEAGTSSGQNQADVAQSIYNRVIAGQYGGSSVREVILATNQYQPTWCYPRPRGATCPNSGSAKQEWRNIQGINSASIASQVTPAQLLQVARNLKNKTLQENSARFIGPRTDFRGNPYKHAVVNSVDRDPNRGNGTNAFGFNKGSRYNGEKGVARVPAFVNDYKLEET